MDILAPISRHVIAPLWAAWERSPYLRHYRDALKTQFDSPAAIRARQTERFRALAVHAVKRTKFWQERFRDSGLTPESITSLNDLKRLPLLTKTDFRERHDDLLASGYDRTKLHRHATSGSTGISVVTYRDEACQQFKRGCLLRCDEWSGWRQGQRSAAIWGNPDYLKHGWRGRLRNALLARQTFLDTLKMDSVTMLHFAEKLQREKPALIFGHAHSIYLLAQFVRARSISGIRPRGIISSAMVLHDWERSLIEDVFKCKVTNRYGCEEVSLIACECERHEGLHVNSDCIYLEVLRPDGTRCEPHETGMLVVTDLTNHAMPIIRYQVGDTGSLSDQPCPCGRGMPLLEKLEGRIADYVVTPTGDLISGISLTDNFACQLPEIVQMQIVQETVDQLTLRIVKGPTFDADCLDRLHQLVAERFGESMHYECEFVDRIAPELSGKYRFCISKVANSFMTMQEVGR